MTPLKITLLVGIALTACSGPVTDGPESDGLDLDASATLGFDLELVREAIVAECEVEPVLFDEETCEQVEAELLTAEGMTLRVPTSLGPADLERAAVICDQIAEMRFAGVSNEDVGFDLIEILDNAGAVAAECASAQ